MSTLDYPPADSLICDGKLNLTLKELPMTIIAALRESSDSILIAADSMQTETGGIRSFTDNKLQHHATAPLAWGIIGNATIGVKFDRWAKALPWPPEDWNELEQQIASYLSELNGNQRRLCSLANAEVGPEDVTSVLVIAYLDEPKILEVDDRGVATVHTREFHAIGSGWPHAHLVHKTIEAMKDALKDTVSPERKLHIVLSLAASCAPQCYPPIVLGRVTPKGFERVTLS